MTPARPQSGSAIVIALLVVGIVALLASSILWRQEMWIADLGVQRERATVRLLARSGADWARAVLAADARLSPIDHLGEPWASKVTPIPVDEGEVGGFLEDQQGRWNLNNLVRNGQPDPLQFEIFQRLLERAGLPIELAFALRDWIDADSDTDSPAGAEDAYYLSQVNPYRAANALLSHVDELQRVRGFSPEVIEKLRPFVTALPDYATINVNTASRQVLAAALRGISEEDLDLLMSRRDRLPFRDLADFRGSLQESAIMLEETILTTASSYFLATITARHRSSAIELTCMIRRQAGRSEILWQRYT